MEDLTEDFRATNRNGATYILLPKLSRIRARIVLTVILDSFVFLCCKEENKNLVKHIAFSLPQKRSIKGSTCPKYNPYQSLPHDDKFPFLELNMLEQQERMFMCYVHG